MSLFPCSVFLVFPLKAVQLANMYNTIHTATASVFLFPCFHSSIFPVFFPCLFANWGSLGTLGTGGKREPGNKGNSGIMDHLVQGELGKRSWGIREHWGGNTTPCLPLFSCWFSLYSVFPSSVPMLPSIPSIVSQYSSCSCCSPCSCSQCSWFPVLVFLVFSVFQCFSVPPSPYSQCLQILFCSQKGTLGTWENQGIIGSGT